MPSFNKFIVMGHLVREIEIKEAQSGATMISNCIATNHKTGGETHATFIDFIIFGRQAELMAEYLGKGDPVLLTGLIQQDNWENANGEKRSKLQMVANEMAFVGSQGDNGNGDNGNSNASRSTMRSGFRDNPMKKPAAKPIQKGEWDDIPF